jgi:hypothetical protein
LGGKGRRERRGERRGEWGGKGASRVMFEKGERNDGQFREEGESKIRRGAFVAWCWRGREGEEWERPGRARGVLVRTPS